MNTFIYDYFAFIEHLVQHKRRDDLFKLMSSLCPPGTTNEQLNFVVDLLDKPIWFRVPSAVVNFNRVASEGNIHE